MDKMDKELGAMLKELRAKQEATGHKSQSTDQDGDKRKLQKYELARKGIAGRFIDTTMESIESKGLPQNESVRKNWKLVRQYVEHLKEHVDDGNGLILAGGYGTMKTTIAVAVLRSHLDAGGDGMMIPMCSLIDTLYTLRNQNAAEAADFEDRIRKAKLLVIDDLGAENNQQGWIMSKVDSIISQRYDNKLATIITTNYGAAGLKETYGGRILDRMKGCCFYLPFIGQSERKPLDIKDI